MKTPNIGVGGERGRWAGRSSLGRGEIGSGSQLFTLGGPGTKKVEDHCSRLNLTSQPEADLNNWVHMEKHMGHDGAGSHKHGHCLTSPLRKSMG